MPKANVGEVELCYDERGEGEALLLIMGFGAQMVVWDDEFCDRLADEGFRVIRFDNRDVGESTKLDHLGVPNVRQSLGRALLGRDVAPPYTLDDMARDAIGLLDHLGVRRAHVVGVSMGGMIAQAMAIHHGDRLASMTSIMSSPGGRRYSIGSPRALGTLIKKPPTTREGYLDHFVSLFRTISGPGYALAEPRLRATAERAYARGLSPKGVSRQFAAITAADRRQQLRNVRVPTLVMHGTHDPLIPERAGRATARLVPGARYVPISGMGHNIPVDAWPLLIGEISRHAKASSR